MEGSISNATQEAYLSSYLTFFVLKCDFSDAIGKLSSQLLSDFKPSFGVET